MDAKERGVRHEKLQYTCPSATTFLTYFAVVVAVVAIVLPLEMNYGFSGFVRQLDLHAQKDMSFFDYLKYRLFAGQHGKNKDHVVMTKEELKKYQGDAVELRLAILGKVYDVTKGRTHYGKDAAYSFFCGIDGSRAFVTGEFNADGLIDDISGLPADSYLGLENWVQLYETEYRCIGKLEGYFYDKHGNPREGVRVNEDGLKAGMSRKKSEEEDRHQFPECNSRWTPDTGTVLWCAQKSGGIERDWVGRPRQYFKPGGKHRCACVKDDYITDPRFKEYEGCDSQTDTCTLVE